MIVQLTVRSGQSHKLSEVIAYLERLTKTAQLDGVVIQIKSVATEVTV